MNHYIAISNLGNLIPIAESDIDSPLWHHTWKYGDISILNCKDGKWYEAWTINEVEKKFRWREIS